MQFLKGYQPYGTMEEVAGIATPCEDPEGERFTGKEFDREGAANGVSGLNANYFGSPREGFKLTLEAVYAEITGDLGPMILVQKPLQSVYYFDNSVYSNQQVTRLEIDLMLKRSVTTTNPPGTFTLNYTDYSVNPSGTNESILVNFERLADSTLVAKGIFTIYGRVVVTSASINISSPDNVSYSVSSSFDLARGQSLLISNEKTISEMNGNANIPDKLVFSYGGNNLTFEYTSLSGEGQIRKGSAGNYYYNYYLKDHLGSTRMIVNDAGDITDAIMYQPYGTMEEVAGIATPGADPGRERFTGKEFDREGKDSANGIPGLSAYYFGARFHDPNLGMWMSCDPADYFWNTYSYVGGNPINASDPDGLAPDYNAASANGGDNAYNNAVTDLYTLSPETWQTMMDANEIFSLSDLNDVISGIQGFNAFMKYMNLITMNDSWLRTATGKLLDAEGFIASYDPTNLIYSHYLVSSTIYTHLNSSIEQRLTGADPSSNIYSHYVGVGTGITISTLISNLKFPGGKASKNILAGTANNIFGMIQNPILQSLFK